ncbi:extracellular solute-binding protein [Anaerobacillus sp. CMMVII]|uniref:ABC transporter substrate-binding protein n=1 Tax=Anaerobacillus sp. CMMVII TaxID=2755588 RepID=UPI0021B7BCA7|nr:extracellular solute-binding protein [Anaerobacillus sp. CMMVII]MCT8137057.1 extracellular solute-binding protein [Anaerobacillus sp. CMMVII]
MRFKEKAFIFITFLLLISVLVACGNDKTSSTDATKTESTEGKDEVITLHFWGGVPAENGPQDAVDAWNANNPNVQIEYTRYVNDDSGNLRVNTALQTKQQIDILMSHSPNDFEQRVESGFVLDLTEFEGFDIEGKIGAAAARWKRNDTYYAVPTNLNAQFFLLNKDLLDQAGLAVPENWTWEDVREYANALDTDTQIGYAIDHGNLNGIILNALIEDGWVKEDGSSNLDHPNVKKGLELMYAMMHQDQTMPKYAEQVATNMAVDHMFLNGEIAMYQAGAWKFRMTNNLTDYPRDFNIAFAPVPSFAGQDNPAHTVEDAISIISYSKHAEAAWEFIKWYADEGMLALSPGGRVPASVDAPIEEALALITIGATESYDQASLSNVYSLETTKPVVVPPYQVLDAIVREFEKYYLGDQSIDDTIERMVKSHNDHLARN